LRCYAGLSWIGLSLRVAGGIIAHQPAFSPPIIGPGRLVIRVVREKHRVLGRLPPCHRPFAPTECNIKAAVPNHTPAAQLVTAIKISMFSPCMRSAGAIPREWKMLQPIRTEGKRGLYLNKREFYKSGQRKNVFIFPLPLISISPRASVTKFLPIRREVVSEICIRLGRQFVSSRLATFTVSPQPS